MVTPRSTLLLRKQAYMDKIQLRLNRKLPRDIKKARKAIENLLDKFVKYDYQAAMLPLFFEKNNQLVAEAIKIEVEQAGYGCIWDNDSLYMTVLLNKEDINNPPSPIKLDCDGDFIEYYYL